MAEAWAAVVAKAVEEVWAEEAWVAARAGVWEQDAGPEDGAQAQAASAPAPVAATRRSTSGALPVPPSYVPSATSPW